MREGARRRPDKTLDRPGKQWTDAIGRDTDPAQDLINFSPAQHNRVPLSLGR